MSDSLNILDAYVKDYLVRKPNAEPSMIAAVASIGSLWGEQVVTCLDVAAAFKRLGVELKGPAPRPMTEVLAQERKYKEAARKRWHDKNKPKGESMTHRTAEEKQAILDHIKSSETRNPKELLEAIVKAKIVSEPLKLSYVKYMIAQSGKPAKKEKKSLKAAKDLSPRVSARTSLMLPLAQGFRLELPSGVAIGDIRYLSLKFCKRDGLCDVESVLCYEHTPITDPHQS